LHTQKKKTVPKKKRAHSGVAGWSVSFSSWTNVGLTHPYNRGRKGKFWKTPHGAHQGKNS